MGINDNTLNFLLQAQDSASDVFKKFGQNVKETGGNAAETEAEVASLSETIKGLKEGVEGLLSVMAGGEILKKATEAFSQYEQALNTLGRATGESGDQLQDLAEKIEMANKAVPTLDAELLKIAETAAKFGMTGNEAIAQFTNTVAEAAHLSGMSTDQMATSLERLTTLFHGSTDDAGELAKSIVLLGDKTVGGSSALLNLSDILGRSLSGYKVSSEEVLALSSTLSNMGGRAEMAAMELSRLFSTMQEATKNPGGETMSLMSRAMGMSAGAASAAIKNDPTESLMNLVQGLAAARQAGMLNTAALQAMGLQATQFDRTLVPLAAHVKDFQSKLEQANNTAEKHEQYEKAAAAAAQLLETNYGMLTKATDQLWKSIGEALKPALVQVMQAVTEGIKGFDKWYQGLDKTQQQILAWEAVIVPLIPALVMAFGLLASAINPVALAVVGVTAALILGVSAWNDWANKSKEAAETAAQIQRYNEQMGEGGLPPEARPAPQTGGKSDMSDTFASRFGFPNPQAAKNYWDLMAETVRSGGAEVQQAMTSLASGGAPNLNYNKAQVDFDKQLNVSLKSAQEQVEMYKTLTASGNDYGKSLAEATALLQKFQEVEKKNAEGKEHITLTKDDIDKIKQAADASYEAKHVQQDAVSGFRQFVEDYTSTALNWGSVMQNTMKSVTSTIENSMVSWVTTGKFNAQQFATSILTEVMRLAVIRPLLATFLGPLGGSFGLGSLTKSAEGNVFQAGNVVPFATGGVVNAPTFFPMANGGTGLMGEAGPEAVMPLTRMSDGRLGVAGGGNNPMHYNSTIVVQHQGGVGVAGGGGSSAVHKVLGQMLDDSVRTTVLQVLERESRPNGLLRGMVNRP